MKYGLVVDDSRIMRKVACRILEDLSIAAAEAEDGAAALRHCRKRMPDVILLDGNMAAGVDFLRSLRGDEAGRHPVVVFCTTEHDIAHISEALGAGADEYLLKPFDRSSIEAKLSEVGLV